MDTRTIPLFDLIPETTENKHFYTNGLSKIIPRLTLKVHSDSEQCYRLWNKFSPRKTLFDLWDYRYAWQKAYGYKMFFYTLYEGRRALGTLPLWYNEKDQRYEWLGGYWMEGNNFFVEDEKLIDLLLTVAPTPLTLMSIEKGSEFDLLHSSDHFKSEEDPKFTKHLENIHSMDSYMRFLTKKHRYNMKSDYNRIMRQNPQIEMISDDDVYHMNEIIELNKKRFDGVHKGMSVFVDLREEEAFRQTIRNSGLFTCKYIKVRIDGHLAASDLILEYNDIYYQMTGANDVMNYSGIGIFMVYLEMQDAIQNNFKTVDCLQEDHTWKHRYFDSREMFEFTK